MGNDSANGKRNRALRSSRGHANLVRKEKIDYGKRGNGRYTKPDYGRIAAMSIAGCPVSVIVKRLKYSESTVRRALKLRQVPTGFNPLVGTRKEWMIWASYRRLGMSYDEVGYRFGLSGEHIRKSIKKMRKA